jgi:hypothetical protein
MMHIERRQQGWTVVNDFGRVMLRDAERAPLYCATRESVLCACHQSGLFEAKPNNAGDYPPGTLLELRVA